MAQKSKLRGDKNFRKLIRRLPTTAHDEMAEILAEAGDDILGEMRRDVANRTGALRAGLSAKLLRRSLRLRVGLIGRPGERRRLFYGFIVELGRKAQTVLVRNRQNTAPYKMRVRQMAPRPFVWKKRIELRGRLNQRIRTYWSGTLADAAQGIGLDD